MRCDVRSVEDRLYYSITSLGVWGLVVKKQRGNEGVDGLEFKLCFEERDCLLVLLVRCDDEEALRKELACAGFGCEEV
jgi:hypothetical protein